MPVEQWPGQVVEGFCLLHFPNTYQWTLASNSRYKEGSRAYFDPALSFILHVQETFRQSQNLR